MQQHKTNMINEEWNKTQNEAPFVSFYDMRAVTFVLPDEIEDMSIVGLQWFILIPRLNHMGSHRPIDSHFIPIYIEKKYWIWNKNYPACCNPKNYGESSCLSLILVASYNMRNLVKIHSIVSDQKFFIEKSLQKHAHDCLCINLS